jgi:uncharacterized protein (DUF362 family)
VATGGLIWGLRQPWWGTRQPVFIARNQRYQGDLTRTIRDGLAAIQIDPASLKGKRILLKPNLVEPVRSRPHMTTHPAMVMAAADVFAGLGATVAIGEAPGHVRDTEMALSESGLGPALREHHLAFADLNYEEIRWFPNLCRVSPLRGLYLPRSVVEADLVVSMPKLKTHHWVGMTASMKNLYGVLPGLKYGWPKNVLHFAGIPQTVIDINATLPRTMAIVDAIDCMEGDGPILGSLKSMGLVVMGQCLSAVDATLARVIGLEPRRIPYLNLAEHRLGPIRESAIEQVGEPWRSVRRDFSILDLPHLRSLRRPARGALVSSVDPMTLKPVLP